LTAKKKVLLIGLSPDVVNYAKWPGLTPEKLEAALQGETAEATVSEALADTSFDCILIGAGVRTDPDEFSLFEKLINVAHEKAPAARICFNSGPTDSVDAVQRWV